MRLGLPTMHSATGYKIGGSSTSKTIMNRPTNGSKLLEIVPKTHLSDNLKYYFPDEVYIHTKRQIIGAFLQRLWLLRSSHGKLQTCILGRINRDLHR